MDINLTKEQQKQIQEAIEKGGEVTLKFDPPKPDKWNPMDFVTNKKEYNRERRKINTINNMLLAYRCEYAPDYVVPPAGEFAAYVFIVDEGEAIYGFDEECRMIGTVYFPEHIAKQFCDDYNAGRIDFGVEG